MLLEIIHAYIEKESQALEDQIFENENKMLEQVRIKLQLT